MLTKKVFTTVVAQTTCFVVKISQRHFTAVFEKHQDDRKKLFSSARRAFSKLCPFSFSFFIEKIACIHLFRLSLV